jgi:pilus assembly protein CpaC
MSRTAVKQLGFNFDIFEGDFRFTSGDTFLKNPAALAGDGFFSLSGNAFSSGLLTGGNIGSVGINALFDALEEIGLVKTLAEPNLTALSGETASFLAGGEFPIPVDQDDNAITIEFKEFGVSLSFTPTLLSPQRISMRVRPEVSQLSGAGAVTSGGISIPALTTRRAETTIELASGQSFAIAGLLQEDFQDTVRQVPYIADVPIIGELFKSEQFRRNETELIIIVTPYLVQPMSERDLPLPTDPLTKSNSKAVVQRSQADLLGRAISVPLGAPDGRQLGEAKYLLD